jgi:hypothetical protein
MKIITVTATLPPRVLIHGQEGVGKTTLAAAFPKPVFIQVEDGCPGGLELSSFGLLDTYPQFRNALTALATDKQYDFKTVVVDSLDVLEKLDLDRRLRIARLAIDRKPRLRQGLRRSRSVVARRSARS